MKHVEKMVSLLQQYIQKMDRGTRYHFNKHLHQYKYLTIYPCIESNQPSYFFVSFTDKNTKLGKLQNHESRQRQEGDFTLYLDSPYAVLFDTDMIISTESIKDLFISPAPLEPLFDAPVLAESDMHHLSYVVHDYVKHRDLPYQAEVDTINVLNQMPNIEFDVVFNDVGAYENRPSQVFGSRTNRLKYNNQVVAFVTASGRELSNVEVYVCNEEQYCKFAEEVIVLAGLKKYIDKPYKMIENTQYVDQYFDYPGVTGLRHTDEGAEDIQ